MARLLAVVIWLLCTKGALLCTSGGGTWFLAMVNLVFVYKGCTFVHLSTFLTFSSGSQPELNLPFRSAPRVFN